MGIHISPPWSLLLLGNLVSLAGLGFPLYQQQLDRAVLRELQLRAELSGPRVVPWTPSSGREQQLGAGPGQPQPGKSDLGWEFEKPGQRTKTSVPPKEETKGSEQEFVFGLVVSGIGLILVIVAGLISYCFLVRGEKEAELGPSPTERQRRLAQRQLAELRLRRHGFGG